MDLPYVNIYDKKQLIIKGGLPNEGILSKCYQIKDLILYVYPVNSTLDWHWIDWLIHPFADLIRSILSETWSTLATLSLSLFYLFLGKHFITLRSSNMAGRYITTDGFWPSWPCWPRDILLRAQKGFEPPKRGDVMGKNLQRWHNYFNTL